MTAGAHPAPATAAAWGELVATLGHLDATFLDPARGTVDEVDGAEGYRHLLDLLRSGFDFYVANDPDHPELRPMVESWTKILGDNTDSRYHFAPLRGDATYRIRGVRGDDCYLAFCVYAGGSEGEQPEAITANVNHRRLGAAPGEAFELRLGPDEDPDDPRAVRLDPRSNAVIVRQYFWEPQSARPARLAIERLSPALPPPGPLDDLATARRLRMLATYLREATAIVPLPPLGPPNTVLEPFAFVSGTPGWGTPDNVYALGSFDLADDEALVIEGTAHPCAYFGVQLWNRYMQSLDWRHHRVSRNGRQLGLGDGRDGRPWRVVIASRDPGDPGWISTAGRQRGTVFCRWLLSDGLPPAPTARVVPVAALGG